MTRRNPDDYGGPDAPDYEYPPGFPPDEAGRAAWIDDRAGHEGLGPRAGDEWSRRRRSGRYPNQRWGATAKLIIEQPARRKATVVVTQMWDEPVVIAFQLRFSLDGVSYSAIMPVGGGVDVTLIKSFDPKAGAANERFGIDPGQTQPVCQVIARALTIVVEFAETAISDLFVQAVACPVTAIDCAEVAGTGGGSLEASIFRSVPSDIGANSITAPGVQIAEANPSREQFVIQNHTDANMYVAFGTIARPPSDPSPRWTLLLPPLTSSPTLGVSNYESPAGGLGYKGVIQAVWDDVDGDPPSGYAMITVVGNGEG
jgi:hypothetical protein